jgi:hypothetical protein
MSTGTGNGYELSPGPAATPPSANAGPNQQQAGLGLVTLDGSASTDYDSVAWTMVGITDAGSVDATGLLSSTTAIGPTFTPGAVGTTYVATLTATAGANTDTDRVAVYIDGGGATWTLPDFTTYAELAGASYDNAGSSYSANGGTAKTTETHGEPDGGLDAGGIVSADLSLTLSDYSAFVAEMDVDDIPAIGSGTKSLYFALLNTNSLQSGKGLYAGVERLASGAYRLVAGIVGANPNISAQHNTVFGRVRITIPFTDTGIPAGISIGGVQAGRAAEFTASSTVEPVAFDTGVRAAILVGVESNNASNDVEIDFSDVAYQFIAKPT